MAPHLGGGELLHETAAYSRQDSAAWEGFADKVDGRMTAGMWNTPSPAVVGLFSVTIVVVPSASWTIVFDAPVSPPRLSGRDAPPAQNWEDGPGYEIHRATGGTTDRIATPQVALSATPAAGAWSSDDSIGSGNDSLANVAFASFGRSGVDSAMRTAGGFLSTAPTASAVNASPESLPQSKIALMPNRLETSEADRDGGLIELESPVERRRKRASKEVDAPADEGLSAERLRHLLEQVWIGWDQAWNAWQELAPASPVPDGSKIAAPDAEFAAAEFAAAEFAAADEGLIELTVDGPVNAVVGQAYVADLHADDGERIRMDAAVALHQSFEVATAPDAAAPTSRSSAQDDGTEAASDKNAKTKHSSDESKRPSAALVGTSLLLSLPFSVFRVREQEVNAVRDRVRSRLKVERLD